MIVTVSFEAPEYEALVKLAIQAGMTAERYIYHCILEHIEDEHDLRCCAEARKQMQNYPQTYTLDQVEEILGIKNDP